MNERCERCKRGYTSPLPKDDLEWFDTPPASLSSGPLAAPAAPAGGSLAAAAAIRVGPGPSPEPGARQMRVGRCTRCNSLLADLVTADRDRPGTPAHDVCVVLHEQARAALVDHAAASIAAVSPQLRRRHLEFLSAQLGGEERATLERIESGVIEATEAFRGLVSRALALATPDLPPINDVRPRNRLPRPASGAAGLRAPLELGDGSRVVLDSAGDKLTLSRMRGDAVAWRAEIPAASREAGVARVAGRSPLELVVLVGPSASDAGGALFVVRGSDGAVRGPAPHGLRASAFEAHALPGGCAFVASYQSCVVVRDDATVVWKGSATGFPAAVPTPEGVVVIDAPWRLVSLALPAGTERWAIPVDRNASLAPAGEGYVLLSTSDSVARIDARGPRPRLVWIAAGASALPLAGGGAALVRERYEKSGRTIECVAIDRDGRRRFAVPRPEATKTPIAELGPGVLLYHSGGDVAVSVSERISYAVAMPAGSTAQVTVEDDGAWIEYDGIVDRVDQSGRRVGRWRVG